MRGSLSDSPLIRHRRARARPASAATKLERWISRGIRFRICGGRGRIHVALHGLGEESWRADRRGASRAARIA